MKGSFSASCLVLALMMPSLGSTSELKPLEGGTFTLGSHIVSIYYTVSGETYDVVATIAPDHDTPGVPIRFTGPLRPGQTETISVGAFGATAAPPTLELVNNGESLSVVQNAEAAGLN